MVGQYLRHRIQERCQHSKQATTRDNNGGYYQTYGAGNVSLVSHPLSKETEHHLLSSQDPNGQAWRQPQTGPYYGGGPVQTEQTNQTLTQSDRPHGGGYVPQQEQPHLDKRHGGGFIPEPQQQPQFDRRHGGGFIPEPQEPPNLGSRHGGGYVPEQEQQHHSERTSSGPRTPNQVGQSLLVGLSSGRHGIAFRLIGNRALDPIRETTSASNKVPR